QTTFWSNKALQLYDWYLKYGYIKDYEEKEKLTRYFYQGMQDLDLQKAGFYERIYYHQTYMWYYYTAQDFQNYYRHCLKFVHAFEEYPEMKQLVLATYMRAVHNICNAFFFLNSYDRFREQFEQSRRIIELIEARDSNNERQYKLYYYLHRIDLHTRRGE